MNDQYDRDRDNFHDRDEGPVPTQERAALMFNRYLDAREASEANPESAELHALAVAAKAESEKAERAAKAAARRR